MGVHGSEEQQVCACREERRSWFGGDGKGVGGGFRRAHVWAAGVESSSERL